ncbi:hypothetical protein [Crenobacter cavernae]|uniref:hypothetical protein n=1 Tax=Crenobacter cavernae TaxID=2290923 RepID=UPI001C696D66|nr:hypothetical protein [Crenobacter cavernae]
MRELILLAHVPTAPVNDGFLPAAKALGLSVVLLTDCTDAHRAHFAHFAQAGLTSRTSNTPTTASSWKRKLRSRRKAR